jgi:hypothetical protein
MTSTNNFTGTTNVSSITSIVPPSAKFSLITEDEMSSVSAEMANEAEYRLLYTERDDEIVERKMWIKEDGEGSAKCGAAFIRHKYSCTFPFSASCFYDTMRAYENR